MVFTLGITLHAQKNENYSAKYIDSIMNANYKTGAPGAVVLAVQNGQIIFEKAYGLANIELGTPNQTKNVFAIGSISKQFAAVAMLKLVQEGKLSLTDKLSKYFPEYAFGKKNITIENILSHTSGIISYTEKQGFDSILVNSVSHKEMIKYFANDSLIFEPGSDWSYSNSGYAVAAVIIEKITGKPYETYIQENIFTPLNMNNTHFLSASEVIPGMVNGYNASNDSTFTKAGYFSPSWILGAGDIVSNVEDMYKWYNGLKENKIINKGLTEKAWTSFILSNGLKANYGYGFAIGEYKGNRIVSHGGAISGFLSDEAFIPEKDIYIVVLSNHVSAKNPSDVTRAAVLLLAGTPYELPEKATSKTKELKQYEGVFEIHRAGSRLAKNMSSNKMYNYLTASNDTLFIQTTGGSKRALTFLGNDKFSNKSRNMFYKFNRRDNRICSMEIYSEPLNYGPNELEIKTDMPLPEKKKAITLSNDILEQYAGRYDLGGDAVFTVEVKNGKIYISSPGDTPDELLPEAENKFFFDKVDATVEFVKENNKVSKLILVQLNKYEAKRID
jgi:CubicO group peptidase (beta-lactamase class C family)